MRNTTRYPAGHNQFLRARAQVTLCAADRSVAACRTIGSRLHMNGFRIKRKQPIIQPWFDVANSQQTVRARILIIDEDQDTHRDFHQALDSGFHTPQYHAGEVVAFQPSFKPSFTMGYDLEHALIASEGVAKIKKS